METSERFLSRGDVERAIGASRSTLARLRAGRINPPGFPAFPEPLTLPYGKRWLRTEVEAWIAASAAYCRERA